MSQKGNLNPNAKMSNKFAYVKGLRTATFDKQLKATAKAIYASDQANKQISKTQKFMNNYVTPFVNAIVTGQCFVQCISHICGASAQQLGSHLS